MKTIGIIFVNAFLITMIFSCENREYNSPIDKGIGLEKNSITFSNSKDSMIVKTENGYWGVSDICEIVNDTAKVIHAGLQEKDTVSFDWYTTYKVGKDIFVKVDANDTGTDRKIMFILMAGNAYDQLLIQQAGE